MVRSGDEFATRFRTAFYFRHYTLVVRASGSRRTNEGGAMGGAFLSDQGITQLLGQLCEHLGKGDAEQADMTLKVLEFERLLKPIEDPTRRRRFIDPAEPFGVERVHETGGPGRTIAANATLFDRPCSGVRV